MNVAVLEGECHHSLALAVLHYQISRKVLDEVVRVVLERLTATHSVAHFLAVHVISSQNWQ